MGKFYKAIILLCVILLCFQGAFAAGPYPNPPPDFSHPGSPHEPLYSPTGGTTDRPLLVVYMQYTDVTFPAAMDAGVVAGRFFGPFPSVAGYFANDSFGKLVLTPAAETESSNNGANNDGVVSISIAMTKANFMAQTEPVRNKQVLQAADPFVNFAAFDANSDGSLTDIEIVIATLEADPDPAGATGCGATRGVDPVSLDGKNMNVSVAMDGSDTNLMTIIHEIGHVTFHMRDLYGFGVGSFDISGPTCGYGDNTYFRTSAWQKMHLDWIDPIVVVKDGYYNVTRADTSGQAYILYDPNKGTNDYFMVENRVQTPNTYDANASDTGLVIWRIDDAQYNSGNDAIRPIDIMRPDGTTTPGCSGGCYGGSSIDAWNPADSNTPQRTMGRTWRDGTASNVAVRAICRAGDVVRAYFDVRGSGILVDATTATCLPTEIDVTPDEANPVSFTVMNTGEGSDTFNFSVTSLPASWTSTTQSQTLGAATGSTANVLVSVPADAPVGTFTVKAYGVSNSDGTVNSDSEFKLRVVLHQTSITYTGLTSVPWGEPAGFKAQVNDITDPSDKINGATVNFTLTDGVNTLTTSALTDATGLVQANPILNVPPGNYTLTVSMPRYGKHDTATITVPYVVERRPTQLVYNGALNAQYSDPAVVSAILTDKLNAAPLAGMTVAFTLGTQNASAVTDGAGVAAATIVLNQPSGNYIVDSSFAGDALYLPSTDSDPFRIDKENLTFVYVGDTLVGLGTTPNLAAQATQEADGSPGDLSLAQALFHLEPTLTLLPFEYTAGLNAGGYGSAAAAGLPVDLWTITVKVPDTNLYWTGASIAPVELVLYDPAASIGGSGHGYDSSSQDIDLTLTGRYQGTLPKGQVQLRSAMGRFKAGDYLWIVVVGNQAIFQVNGNLDGVALALRVRFQDVGEAGVGSDTFLAWIRDLGGNTLYDSGVVLLQGGNLQVLKP